MIYTVVSKKLENIEFRLNFVGILWDFVGILLEFCWNFVGILLEFCWNFVGIYGIFSV